MSAARGVGAVEELMRVDMVRLMVHMKQRVHEIRVEANERMIGV